MAKHIDMDALEHDMRCYGPSACADGDTVLALIARVRAAEESHSNLLTAAHEAADQIRRCDYTPARSTLLRAITDASMEVRHG